MQTINALFRWAGRFERIALLSGDSLALLLRGGQRHVIVPNPCLEGPTCGLIPVGRPCQRVQTSGLRWNLPSPLSGKGTKAGLAFGGLVSSSNGFADDDQPRVVVEASGDLLWTTELSFGNVE
jgi:hypothetical protein